MEDYKPSEEACKRIEAHLQKVAAQMREEALVQIASLETEKAELERREQELRREMSK